MNAFGWIILALLIFAAFIWIVKQWKSEQFYNPPQGRDTQPADSKNR
jgi:hypothetical protein